MRTLLLALHFTLLAVIAAKYCSDIHDCDLNKCCLQKGYGTRGICTPLAKEGHSCSREPYPMAFGWMFTKDCPCASGLFCEASEYQLPFGMKGRFRGRCVRENTASLSTLSTPEDVTTTTVTAAKYCSDIYDCDLNKCCVQVGYGTGGICTPLAKEGHSCSKEPHPMAFGWMYIKDCPCVSGLFCELSKYELPFGVKGRFRGRCIRESTTPLSTKSTPEDVTTTTDLRTEEPVDITTFTNVQTEETDVVTDGEITDVQTEDETGGVTPPPDEDDNDDSNEED